jgi:hypothetical protein
MRKPFHAVAVTFAIVLAAVLRFPPLSGSVVQVTNRSHPQYPKRGTVTSISNVTQLKIDFGGGNVSTVASPSVVVVDAGTAFRQEVAQMPSVFRWPKGEKKLFKLTLSDTLPSIARQLQLPVDFVMDKTSRKRVVKYMPQTRVALAQLAVDIAPDAIDDVLALLQSIAGKPEPRKRARRGGAAAPAAAASRRSSRSQQQSQSQGYSDDDE